MDPDERRRLFELIALVKAEQQVARSPQISAVMRVRMHSLLICMAAIDHVFVGSDTAMMGVSWWPRDTGAGRTRQLASDHPPVLHCTIRGGILTDRICPMTMQTCWSRTECVAVLLTAPLQRHV